MVSYQDLLAFISAGGCGLQRCRIVPLMAAIAGATSARTVCNRLWVGSDTVLGSGWALIRRLQLETSYPALQVCSVGSAADGRGRHGDAVTTHVSEASSAGLKPLVLTSLPEPLLTSQALYMLVMGKCLTCVSTPSGTRPDCRFAATPLARRPPLSDRNQTKCDSSINSSSLCSCSDSAGEEIQKLFYSLC